MEPFGDDCFLPSSRDDEYNDNDESDNNDEYNDNDEYDLVVLNFYIFLKAACQENAALTQRILTHWETFQRHRDAGKRNIHIKEQSYYSID